MPTKAVMTELLEEIVERANDDKADGSTIKDITRRALGRKDTVNEACLHVHLECFETDAGPQETLAEDLEFTVTYRGKPIEVISMDVYNYNCSWKTSKRRDDGKEEEDEE